MGALKITDRQLVEYLRKGMTMKEIAQVANMSYQYIWQRVKKIEKSGVLVDLLIQGKEKNSIRLDNGTVIRKLDTLAKLSSKRRYRVAHIYEGAAILKEVPGENYLLTHKITPTVVSKAALENEFEKKEINSVTCYVDKSLIEKKEETSADEAKRKEKDVDAFLCDYKYRR